MKNTTTLIILILANLNIGISQNFNIGDSLRVNAPSGLNLREKPNVDSRQIELLNYGDLIIVKSQPNKNSVTEVNGISGNWIKVKTKNTSGYVFDFWITKLPTLNLSQVNSYNCLTDQIKDYFLHDIGIIDSVTYSNYIDGESYHRMNIYDLSDGHQYINHSYWEGEDIEIHLENVSNNEGVNLLKLIQKKCKISCDENMGEFSKIQLDGLEQEKQFCSFRLRRMGNMLIIKTEPRL
jgi:hypothetical protein